MKLSPDTTTYVQSKQVKWANVKENAAVSYLQAETWKVWGIESRVHMFKHYFFTITTSPVLFWIRKWVFWLWILFTLVGYFSNERANVHIKITFRRVRLTIITVDMQNYYLFYTCVFSLRYTACTVFYCNLWPIRLYHIFPYYLINYKIFGNKVIEDKIWVLIFSTTYVWNISHPKKNSAWYYHIYYICRRVTNPLFMSDFNRNWTFSRILRNLLKYITSWKYFQC